MSVVEGWLRDVWMSCQSEAVARVDCELEGPVSLVQRALVAFKELGCNYVGCVKELNNVKQKLEDTTHQLAAANERLNETQKPCELCEVLSKQLSEAESRAREAESRAKDAEDRVTQIAQILVSRDVNTRTKTPESPRRKKSCLRYKEGEMISQVVGDISSQVVETGRRDELHTVTPLSSRSANSPKEDKRGCFEMSSPRKSKRLSAKENHLEPAVGLAESCASELDRIWFNQSPARKGSDRVIDQSPARKGSERIIAESPVSPIEIMNKPKERCEGLRVRRTNKSKSEKAAMNPDNSYDIVFEKRASRKKLKQLTLEMKPPQRHPLPEKQHLSADRQAGPADQQAGPADRQPLSDSEDIILPSPDKNLGETSGGDSSARGSQVQESRTAESRAAESRTTESQTTESQATESRTDESRAVNLPVTNQLVDKRPAIGGSSRVMDNSFDVIADKKKTPSPPHKYIGKTVRGRARAQLEGWDCHDCKRFYEVACRDQSASQVKAAMNLCSRHRSKHKHTRPPTPPGFWDIDIPDTPES